MIDIREYGLANRKGEPIMLFIKRTKALFCGIMCISSLAIVGCSPQRSTGEAGHLPSPVTQSGMVMDWGEDVKRQALLLIQASQHTCYLDIYELSDVDIIQALAAAHRRGVDVRVVLDATEKHSQTVGYPTLLKDGIQVRVLTIPRGISHIKMLSVDQHVLIGGMNYGAHSWLNNDASIYIEQTNMSFTSLFLWDYNRANGHLHAAPKVTPPLMYDRNIKEHVLSAIQNAHQTIIMEAFDLTDKTVIRALESAVRREVTVEVLLDPTQSYNRIPASTLRDAGVTVRFYRPYQGELMHAKIVDVDHGSVFIIGSANFSHQAFSYNHEGDIELHNVPAFDTSLQNDLTIQIARGTDYPAHNSQKW